jgi:hypothetical protein
MISNNYNPSKDILKVVEQLIDIQWESKGCDYDFYEEIIDKLSTKLGNEKVEALRIRLLENNVEYSCENETCRKYYYGDYEDGFCSDECRG